MQSTPPTPPKRSPSEYDAALKKLLETAHDGFLALIAPDVTFEAALPTELPATTRLADLVWAVTFDAGQQEDAPDGSGENVGASRHKGLLHIELQTRAEVDLAERLVEYALRLWLRERRERRAQGEVDPAVYVRTIVVVLRPTAALVMPPLQMLWGKERRLEFTYDVVKLWELPPELVLDTHYYQLWPLASLMANITPTSAVAVAERLADAPLPRAERSDLIGLLITLAGVRLGKVDLVAALRGNLMLDDLLKESNIGEVMHDLAVERDRREALRLVLEGRFGTLPDDMIAAMNQRDGDALAELLRHAGTDTLEQMRARLGLS
ncbi:MAG TPA: hypothetical protein VF510_01790 [Ktedonobacterales bacterium]